VAGRPPPGQQRGCHLTTPQKLARLGKPSRAAEQGGLFEPREYRWL